MLATAEPQTEPMLTATDQTSDRIRDMIAAHGPFLLATVTRIVRDRALAEDIVQETLVRAWRNIDRLDTSCELATRGWLIRVARNIVVDMFRARKARPAEVAESAAMGMSIPDPTDELVRNLQVRAALARLSEAHRTVLRECYFNDSTLAQAADTLDIPLGTVKSRLFSAVCRLRTLLAEPSADAA